MLEAAAASADNTVADGCRYRPTEKIYATWLLYYRHTGAFQQ